MDADQETAFPLSFEQYCVWRTARSCDRWCSGHVDLELQIDGALDVPAFTHALQDVFARHASLRTTFFEHDGHPCQRVESSATLQVRVHGGGVLLTAGHGDTDSSSFRAQLRAMSPLSHVLELRTHRAVFDAASTGVLWSDLSAAYCARSEGRAPSWAALPEDYRGFVDLQRKVLGYGKHQDPSGATPFARHLRFWRRYLDGVAGAAGPSARGVPAEAFAEVPIRVPPNVVRIARRWASSRRTTLDMVLRAALARSLALRTGKTELILATATEGLYRRRARGAIGLFASDLLFRYEEVAGVSFAELLEHVRTRDIAAHQRPYLPASFIVRQLAGVPADEIVDAVLTVHEHAPFECRLASLTTRATVRCVPIERYALTVELLETRETTGQWALEGNLLYGAHRSNRAESLAVWDGMLAVLEESADALGVRDFDPVEPWKLSAVLHENRYLAPHDPLQYQLVSVWEDVLRCFPIGVWDDFFALGGNAQRAAEMIERVSSKVDREVSLSHASEPCTIELLADKLLASLPRVPAIHLRRGNLSDPTFFYLHGDFNGGGSYCAELSRHLESCRSLCVLPPHDLNGRPIPETLEEMAEDHLVTVRRLQPHGPYLLAGHCNGGLIAYEIARRLTLAGESVKFVGVIHAQFMQSRAEAAKDRLAPLPAVTAPAHGSAVLKLERRASALRFARYRVPMWSYRPDTYDGKVTLFWPKEESFFSVSPEVAWQRVARETELHFVAGDHLTCITTCVEDLGKHLNQCLRRCFEQIQRDRRHALLATQL